MILDIKEKFFERMFELFLEMSNEWQIVIGAVILGFIFFSGSGMLWLIKSKVFKRTITKNRKISKKQELYDHDLFVKKDQYIRMAKDSDFTHKTKDFVFHTILTTKIDTIMDKATKYIKHTDINKRNIQSYKRSLYDNISDIIKTYNFLIKQKFRLRFGEEKGDEIFEFVMNAPPNSLKKRVAGFNKWHDKRAKEVEEFVEMICKSKAFDNNLERHELYQHELSRACYMAVNDAQKVYRNFNGDLNKLLGINNEK